MFGKRRKRKNPPAAFSKSPSPTDIADLQVRELGRVPWSGLHAFNTVVSTRYGLMIVHRGDMYVGKSLELYGEYNRDEADLLGSLVWDGDTVVDAGANLGAVTVPMSQWVGDTGHVLAFEPQPLTFQALCGNLALNSCRNVSPFQVALGAPGVDAANFPVVDPCIPGNFGGIGRVDPETQKDLPTYAVTVAQLDRFDLVRLNVLKVDVEGMEGDVLEGARDTLARHHPVLYVENDRREKQGAVIAQLDGMGFDVWWHRPPLYSPGNWRREPVNVFGDIVSLNMVAVPRVDEDRLNEARAMVALHPGCEAA